MIYRNEFVRPVGSHEWQRGPMSVVNFLERKADDLDEIENLFSHWAIYDFLYLRESRIVFAFTMTPDSEYLAMWTEAKIEV